MNSVETLLKDKLKNIIEDKKKSIASSLLISEAEFGKPGRPLGHAPSDNIGDKRKNAQDRMFKDKEKVQNLQQKMVGNPSSTDTSKKLQIARTKLQLDTQKLQQMR